MPLPEPLRNAPGPVESADASPAGRQGVRHPSRRRFLAGLLSGGAVVSAGGAAPGFLRALSAAASSPQAASAEARAAADSAAKLAGAGPVADRVLVVVQLSGGNDGLNTVVPFRDPLYFRHRPSIAVDPARVHRLDDRLALHPAMGDAAKLFEAGRLTVVQGVGYPDPSRSHFVSMDIWHTARPGNKPDRTDGWLGRTLAADPARREGRLSGLCIGERELPPALAGQRVQVPAVEDLAGFRLKLTGGDDTERRRRAALLRDLARSPDAAAGGPPASGDPAALAEWVRATMHSTYVSAESLAEAAARPGARTKWPTDSLGRNLRQISQVIAAGFGARVYYCTLGGFDTHAKQVPAHASLLGRVSAALAAFDEDLTVQGRRRDVLVMVFSEFGRRVGQNASHGTDHGTAGPMFLLRAGGKGLVGAAPDLERLIDGGDLRHGIDFRSVYAAVLERWFGIPATTVLGPGCPPAAEVL